MKHIVNFYFRHRTLVLFLTTAIVGAAIMHWPQLAHAQGIEADPETSKLLNDINGYLIIAIKGVSMILWPVVLMIGSLLDNDLIFGGAMGERLLEVWVQVRNLVNILFVLILLFIAVFNVLGQGDELGGFSLGFKKIMPKFIIALVAVNFSFLGVKIVLDFTNVITGAVFAIPSTAIERQYDIKDEIRVNICGTSSTEVPMKSLWCKGTELSSRAESFFARFDRNNVTVAYAVRFGRVPQLKFIRDGLKGITQLTFNVLFNLVLFIVYAVSFVALFIVLLARLVVLWLVVALSPLLAVGIVMPNLAKLGGGSEKLQGYFVKSATAPIVIGFVLSLGYVMLDAFSIDKNIHGALLSSSSIDAIDSNAIPTDIGDLQQLMVAVGSVAIIWLGVFGATEGVVGQGIIDSIKGYTAGFGKFMGKLPAYAQILPTGKKRDGKELKGSLMQMLNEPKRLMEDFIRKGTFFEGSHGDPKTRMNEWKDKAPNPKEFAKIFLRDLGLITSAEGKKNMVEALQIHDKKLADAIMGSSPGNIAQKIKDAENAGSEHAKEIFAAAGKDAAKLQRDFEEMTKLENRAPGSESTENASKPVEDPIAALNDTSKKSADLAKMPAFQFKKWTEQEVDTLRKLPATVRSAILEVQDNKVQNHLTTGQLNAAQALVKSLASGSLRDAAGIEQVLNAALGGGLNKAVRLDIIQSTNIDQTLKDNAKKANDSMTQ